MNGYQNNTFILVLGLEVMCKAEALLIRLDEIVQALTKRSTALALIGLGSVGEELGRLDDYSDLDFFVIVSKGAKKQYLDDLSWLSKIAPVAYFYQNTTDGYKLLYEDGIFCEFAVFELQELDNVPFAPGRIVWKRNGVANDISVPKKKNYQNGKATKEWLMGEVLTNLYVGLCREKRGEKLAAMRMIQVYAVDRILELSPLIEEPKNVLIDSFAPERRFEARFPEVSSFLPSFVQGYVRNQESAFAILKFLETYLEINPGMGQAIRLFFE
jgi:hypothetical protein